MSAVSKALNVALPAIVVQSSLQAWAASHKAALVSEFDQFCARQNADALVVCFLATAPKLARHIVVYSRSRTLAADIIFGVDGAGNDKIPTASGVVGSFSAATGRFDPSMLHLSPISLGLPDVSAATFDPFSGPIAAMNTLADSNAESASQDATAPTLTAGAVAAARARLLSNGSQAADSAIATPLPVLVAFTQSETAHSRKQILPIVEAVVAAAAAARSAAAADAVAADDDGAAPA